LREYFIEKKIGQTKVRFFHSCSSRDIANGKSAIHSLPCKSCPLGVVVIAPLKQRGETIGTLKFYFASKKEITPVTMELISGLSSLLRHQLELADADKSDQLTKEAKIKALQAQISPHFLFITLNTIHSLVRVDPAKARKLLVSLSHFLRQNLFGHYPKDDYVRVRIKACKSPFSNRTS
jgi:LytS/YehU family sensor histidine kinase